MKNFIMTTNLDTANRLKCLGFNLLSDSENKWIFMNDGKITFSEMPDVIFTNKLFI